VVDEAVIYRDHAETFDRLVAAEDGDGVLLSLLESRLTLACARVVDVGTGTGWVARRLVQRGADVIGIDRAPAMLRVAKHNLEADDDAAIAAGVAQPRRGRWWLYEADARALPVASHAADLAIAGWVFGHLRYWMPEDWQDAIGRAVAEMRRAVRPGGQVIVVETLGVGVTEPAPPAALAEYYRWLEEAQGFARVEVRTDFCFGSTAEAADLCGFFFGPALGALVRQNQWRRVPECTGVWLAQA
jgi:SAM-dependent methyltransferase